MFCYHLMILKISSSLKISIAWNRNFWELFRGVNPPNPPHLAHNTGCVCTSVLLCARACACVCVCVRANVLMEISWCLCVSACVCACACAVAFVCVCLQMQTYLPAYFILIERVSRQSSCKVNRVKINQMIIYRRIIITGKMQVHTIFPLKSILIFHKIFVL